jgi:hypothetical protein
LCPYRPSERRDLGRPRQRWKEQEDYALIYISLNNLLAIPSCRAVLGLSLQPLYCWDRGFESHRGM